MSFLTTIFAPGEQGRSDELDRRRAELEQERARRGLITQEQADANANKIYNERLDVETELADSFQEGLKEGYDNVTGGISSTIKSPFKFIWDAVPGFVWILAAFALFVYMGGGVYLKGILRKK